MSVPLATVDLTSVGIGQSKTIDFQQYVKVDVGQPLNIKGHLAIYNDSGCGLKYLMKNSNRGGYIPAGGWQPLELNRDDGQCAITVIYTLPNPPVSLVMPTYYEPGEPVPASPVLGNSPIGGGVTTSAIQTLSNEGGARNVLVLDIGDLAIANLIQLFTDHFILKVDQAGVAHTVLQAQIAGNPALIGQAGDIAEILGALTVDQTTIHSDTVTITASVDGNKGLVIKPHSSTQSVNMLEVDDQIGTQQVWVDSARSFHANQGLSTSGITLTSGGSITFPITGSLSNWQLVSGSVAAGPTTIAHSLGKVPDIALIVQNQSSADTFNFIYDKAGSTTTNAKFWGTAGAVTARPFLALLISF